jgi:hypothetical protein
MGGGPFGSIILMRPVPIPLAASMSVLLTAVICMFLAMGQYTPKVRRRTNCAGWRCGQGGGTAVWPHCGVPCSPKVVVTVQLQVIASSERNTGNSNIDARINAVLAESRNCSIKSSRCRSSN